MIDFKEAIFRKEGPNDWTFSLWSPSEIPSIFKRQILDFYRCQWPWGFKGNDLFRDWITGDLDHPRHLILSHEDTLIGAATIVSRSIMLPDSSDEPELVGGITGVLIYPNFQKMGLGKALIQEAIEILSATYQTILFQCEEAQVPFYTKLGMLELSDIQVFIGDRDQPELSDGILMGFRPQSNIRADWENFSKKVYFGPYSW